MREDRACWAGTASLLYMPAKGTGLSGAGGGTPWLTLRRRKCLGGSEASSPPMAAGRLALLPCSKASLCCCTAVYVPLPLYYASYLSSSLFLHCTIPLTPSALCIKTFPTFFPSFLLLLHPGEQHEACYASIFFLLFAFYTLLPKVLSLACSTCRAF